MLSKIHHYLEKQKAETLYRFLRPIQKRQGNQIFIGGKEYFDFSTNDYLGLSNHPLMAQAASMAAETSGTGGTGSRLLGGNLSLHEELEEKIAYFKGKPKALVYNSGYQANLGILSSLCSSGDVIFSDRLNHASIMDAIRLSGAELFRFRHNDSNHLESLLKKHRGKFKGSLIVTETVFSMDGDLCPLSDLTDLKEKYDSLLMVDEAHATGVFGKNGEGFVSEKGLESKVDLIMGTFGKALGSFGAYVASETEIIDYLINTSRSFIYSTSLPPPVIAANLKALEIVREEPLRRQSLLANATHLRQALAKKGIDFRGESQIIPVIIGDNLKTVQLSEILKEAGFWLLPIRHPTVPRGEARLRISLTAGHDPALVNRLYELLAKYLPGL